MKRRSFMPVWRTAIAAFAAFLIIAPASAQTNPQKLVADAQTTLANFMRDPDQT